MTAQVAFEVNYQNVQGIAPVQTAVVVNPAYITKNWIVRNEYQWEYNNNSEEQFVFYLSVSIVSFIYYFLPKNISCYDDDDELD